MHFFRDLNPMTSCPNRIWVHKFLLICSHSHDVSGLFRVYTHHRSAGLFFLCLQNSVLVSVIKNCREFFYTEKWETMATIFFCIVSNAVPASCNVIRDSQVLEGVGFKQQLILWNLLLPSIGIWWRLFWWWRLSFCCGGTACWISDFNDIAPFL